MYGYVLLAILATVCAAVIAAWVVVGNELRTVFREAGGLGRRVQFVLNKMKARDSIPQVVIDEKGGHKYVVIEYCDKIYVRADARMNYHAGLVADFFYNVGGGKVRCLGGGNIGVDPEAKTFYISGRSQQYGSDQDPARTSTLIQQSLGLKPK